MCFDKSLRLQRYKNILIFANFRAEKIEYSYIFLKKKKRQTAVSFD